MKTPLAALSIVLLAGCGSDSPSPPIFGGFEPQDQAALIFAPTTCDIPFVGTASVAAVAVYFTDYLGACDVIPLVEFCGTRENSATVIGLAVSGLVGGGAIGPAGPGTYVSLRDPPESGAFLAASADAGKVGAACEAVPGGNLDLVSGQIVLASASDTAVTGTVDFRFDDGSAFTHGVDATVCPLTLDLCQLFEPCWDYACAPAP